MPQSNWRSNIALGGWVVAGVLFALIYSQWVADEFSFRHLKGRNKTSEAQYQGNDAKHTGTAFKNQPPSNEYKPDCSKREDADLCAQRRMAQAAEDQTALNVMNVVLLFGTLVFTGWAAWAATQAARHSARSADVQIRIEQPFFYVESIYDRIDPPDDVYRCATLTVIASNVGKGPGILTAWSMQCATFFESLPATPTYGGVVKLRGSVVRPGDKVLDSYPIVLTDEQADAIHNGMTAHFWGFFLYEDIFGRLHRTGFGFEGHPRRADGPDGPGPLMGLLWARAGGKAYNYDREEDA